MPARYRFFFRFFSATKQIYFVWINEAQNIRRKGDRRDVYREFQRRLDSEKLPETHGELAQVCTVEKKPEDL